MNVLSTEKYLCKLFLMCIIKDKFNFNLMYSYKRFFLKKGILNIFTILSIFTINNLNVAIKSE